MIADSSPLIVFGKLNKVDTLLKLFKQIEIAEGVHKEAVLDGMDKKFEDSLILKSYVDSAKIKVVRLEGRYMEMANKIQHFNSIGVGESQTIALAKQLNAKELIINESLARETAKSCGLIPIGSLKVLLLAYEKRILSEKELKEAVNKIVKIKFRISAATLIRFWELFEKIRKDG